VTGRRVMIAEAKGRWRSVVGDLPQASSAWPARWIGPLCPPLSSEPIASSRYPDPAKAREVERAASEMLHRIALPVASTGVLL
jgi:hypothetical protein